LNGEPDRWVSDPGRLRLACDKAVRDLIALPTRTPSSRLLADQSADVLAGISHTLSALGLLVYDPIRPVLRRSGRVRFRVPDFLPAFVSAVRAFVAIGAVAIIWIVTGWPSGATAITWVAIPVILFAPRADEAYPSVVDFAIGSGLSAVCAAIINFAVLPGLVGFASFCLALGIVLVRGGALMVQPWRTAMFTAMAVNFVPLLAPENQMTYDPQQFYNGSSALIAGIVAAALAFRLLPPLPPALRTRRLLVLTLRDLRHLTEGRSPRTASDWKGRIYSRLSALPEQAQPLQRAQLLAALSVGTEIILLRRVARLFDARLGLDAALDTVARGDSVVAAAGLASVDRRLAELCGTRPGPRIRLRVRASLLALSEALTRHAAYFDTRVPG
jgi:uncharacterized membrane protein YccC